MSEYWKSTPNYWCKYCAAFVRDTPLSRQNHDATPKHQGNLKRFLRDLHRGHEKDEKDKDRAKSEVARLNGLVTGSGTSSSSSSSGLGRGLIPTIPKPQATPSQRKQQVAQLAEMGVSIPDEFRGEMAMAGDWQVTSERIIQSNENGEKKPEALGFGIRKRVIEDEEAEAMQAKKKRWGSTFRTHPEDKDDLDLDQLLNSSLVKIKTSDLPSVKNEVSEAGDTAKVLIKSENVAEDNEASAVKKEPSEEGITLPIDDKEVIDATDKREIEESAGGFVFKKRSKAKNIRQK